jgi:exo-beta-1,3-glucanase (GH17 family)
MKKITFILLCIWSQLSQSSSGTFFNLETGGTAFNISTTGSYITAGIKITSGQTLFCRGTTTAEGYCIFPVTSSSPDNAIGFSGVAGNISVNLCLNGNGPATCGTYGPTPFTPYTGVNYDPAHSSVYTTGQQNNDVNAMNTSMASDFAQIKNNSFSLVKTFISVASTDAGTPTNTLASIACPMGLKLMLGVYEFTPADGCNDNTTCIAWTQPQISAAIASATAYPQCIVGIAVGNEDMYVSPSEPNTDIQQRISNDITTIRNAIGNVTPIGSAQQDGTWLSLAGDDPYGIIPKLDFVGTNIYPYWSGTSVADAPGEFTNRLNAVKAAYPNTRVIVTEEGWPSSSNNPPQPAASLADEVTYYQYWLNRLPADNFDSYYFSFYNKQNVAPNVGSADNFFGLCAVDGSKKSDSLISCASPP